ncbi:hypothetical protein VQ042_11530 [Aurantimonas sp. A2-1-M11]|uniref:hypothetical protein n=1 Tax=Aurantimonas sp. A2-1-M11 TaxID=3113712 RepID=UPI002F95FF4D
MLRLVRAALVASTMLASLCYTTIPANADPIFMPIALAAFQAGASVTVANAIIGVGVLGSIASTVGTIALGLGVSYVASLFNRPQQPKPSDGQVEARQAVPPRVWHYGRMKVAGSLAFYESRDGTLYKAILISSRQIDAIEQIYLQDSAVTVDGAGWVQTAPYENGSNPLVRIATHLGTDDQTVDAYLNGAFSEWTTNHRLRGTAYAVVYCKTGPDDEFQAHYPSGEPQLSALVRGARIYDPRKDSTVSGGSGAHRHSNKATWEWSDNAALVILDYLTHEDGYDRSIAKMDLPSFIAMANLCDEAVPLAAGGSERRYRVATSVALTEARKDVLSRLLEACDARLFPTQDGRVSIKGGKWEEPTVTIDADEGHIIETNFAPPDAMSRFNELSIQYLDPALGYVENEGEPWQDSADIAATGQLVTVPADMVQVPSHSQARRLTKIRMARENSDWVGEIAANLAGLNVIGERVITLNWPELDINGPYWVEGGPEIAQDWSGVRLSLRSANAASYDWTTAEEGTSTSVPPDTSPVLNLTPPTITLSQIAGPAIRADWTPSQALNRNYEVQFRADAASTYTAMTVAETRDSAESAVVEGGLHQVRIRMNAGFTAVGPWSGDYPITIEFAPTNSALPVISGTTAEGQTLTSTTGTWSGYPTPTYAYQWKRDGVAISGATASTYTLVAADVGTTITVTVTATNSEGSDTATSAGVGPVT